MLAILGLFSRQTVANFRRSDALAVFHWLFSDGRTHWLFSGLTTAGGSSTKKAGGPFFLMKVERGAQERRDGGDKREYPGLALGLAWVANSTACVLPVGAPMGGPMVFEGGVP